MKLTHEQKLQAMALKYYQGMVWRPKKGDFYTSSRADLELYQVVEVSDTQVVTKYTEGSEELSYWGKHEFTNEGFGLNRVWVPDFVLEAEQ